MLPLYIPYSTAGPPLRPLTFLRFFIRVVSSLVLHAFIIRSLFTAIRVLFAALYGGLEEVLFFRYGRRFLVRVGRRFFLFPILGSSRHMM